MQKIYSDDVFSYIQSLMDTGHVDIKHFNDYSEILPMNRITLGEIQVAFTKSESPKIPGYNAGMILKEGIGQLYTDNWNQLPIKSHMVKDFKMLRLDKNGNIPYIEITFEDVSNNKKKALLRELYEIDDMDAEDPECLDYYNKYTDIENCDKAYMVVKIVDDGALYTQYDSTYMSNDIVDVTISQRHYTPTQQTENEKDNTPNSPALF
jgi:hypothetical protein